MSKTVDWYTDRTNPSGIFQEYEFEEKEIKIVFTFILALTGAS